MKLFSLTSLVALAFIGCDNSTQQATPSVAKETGKDIYMMYCAQCHGATGDGKGLIELDRPARSFSDGGFSFGNTVHAISKTTSSGIPGTPMPPFSDVLTKEQIFLVANYVRDFAPTQAAVTVEETEMVVGIRPLIVRGMIPPVQDGRKLHPRGIVIGNPDGFSYEYRVDDVRLLAIRQGRFVSREDWGERGGSPLKLLGKITVLVQNGNPNSMFETNSGQPLHARLTATNTLGNQGILKYDLVNTDGDRVASVQEYCAPTTGARALLEQHLAIEALAPCKIIELDGTVLEGGTDIPVGSTTRTVIHATKGSE
jgi:mono/diheme cytochrome c family protein